LPDGSVLVSDAAANDLLRVYPHGRIITVARLKPRGVAVPHELRHVGFPPAGTLLPSEAVATSVTVGADGYYYVGELRGFPATPGTSHVWRVAPGGGHAGCAPGGRAPGGGGGRPLLLRGCVAWLPAPPGALAGRAPRPGRGECELPPGASRH